MENIQKRKMAYSTSILPNTSTKQQNSINSKTNYYQKLPNSDYNEFNNNKNHIGRETTKMVNNTNENTSMNTTHNVQINDTYEEDNNITFQTKQSNW
jgi:hypothetical protein